MPKETPQTFKPGTWQSEIDVRDFIQQNYTPYVGDDTFLKPPTKKTQVIWDKISKLIKKEVEKGILDLDVKTPSTITSHKPGFIDKQNESIIGLQTDKPLKRAIKPNGGIRLVEKAAEAYGYEIPKETSRIFYRYRKTHNDGVFDAYTPEFMLLRSKHILTGLPDNYGRGRIIGDYRRLALYGADRLIEEKKVDLSRLPKEMDGENIRDREEISDQIKALEDIKQMAKDYGFDVSVPAEDSKQAVQWTYFAYLASVKEQDGAAMSLGRVDAFFDIYFENDLKSGKYTEDEIQEFVDQFVIKLRIVRHLRHPEYDQLFAGDPTWVTLVLGGTGLDGRNMITKTSFRFLHTLSNLGPAPEPNLTVLWGENQPETWKKFCAKTSINSSSIQYENDDMMKPYYGDDYGIACCVSGMAIGKEMQFFGARANLAKILLLAINGGREEPLTHKPDSKYGEDQKGHGENIDSEGGAVIIPGLEPLNKSEYLDYNEVWTRFIQLLDWLSERYVGIMNVIHFMHDKYHYEKAQMAFHDEKVKRYMSFGAAGVSVVADALSAIKHAKVSPVWGKNGVAKGFKIKGEYPAFGNDDDEVDSIAVNTVKEFITALKRYETYREAEPTLSILTITSNVVYGKATGETPDGRKSGAPFAPGANPMHGRDKNGAISSLNSVAKLPYEFCQDGISNTFSIIPQSLGKGDDEQISNLVQMLDGYFVGKDGHHLNVNVFNRETLLDAQKHPEKYPQLTIRVSGYAVLFNRLNKEQQDEVISRTFHNTM